ncbi:MAG: TonB-dependent receptor plug domain-containing protein, partial [Bacteroidaceae bacterium]|nr:TonB-dependent receptor plug domain-containing protein [Bacteroidaceae bacterium]
MFTPVPEQLDTVVLQGVDIVASIKSDGDDNRSAYSSTKIGRVQIEERHLQTMKELSSIAPNFYQPDYGSRMTSSIYVRGFGSRIDQPVVGLNVDEIPVLNKNNYDFDFFDIQSVQIIRGAQSTLYGRNTAGGTMNITTMSPLTFQGKRLMLGYANGNALRLKASHYEALNERFGWSASVNYAHSDGFFKNKELGDYCDGGDNVTARLRMQYISSGHLSLDNILTISYVDEGGYAYRAYDASDGTLAPVAYNDPCSYRRLNVSDGFVVKR